MSVDGVWCRRRVFLDHRATDADFASWKRISCVVWRWRLPLEIYCDRRRAGRKEGGRGRWLVPIGNWGWHSRIVVESFEICSSNVSDGGGQDGDGGRKDLQVGEPSAAAEERLSPPELESFLRSRESS